MAEELSGTETLRTDFIANVSHELKTPLAVMGNYATMLQRPGITEEETNGCAKSISEAARKLAQLITNILKLNKLENQQIFPQPTEYDLSEQLCQALLQFEDAWECKDLSIETDIIEEDVRIRSDPELLSLVWNNLISNAVKFTPEGGSVCVSLKAADAHVTVSVRDTGCGMKPETGLHIFEKFYQGDPSHAIVDTVRCRTLGSPIMSTAKIVSLSAALVSMLNLETAMFAQFGADMTQQDQNLMIILTAAGISVAVATLSALLIAKATNEIRRDPYGE